MRSMKISMPPIAAGKADCQEGETCLTHYLWCDLSEQIHHFLASISLAQLVIAQ